MPSPISSQKAAPALRLSSMLPQCLSPQRQAVQLKGLQLPQASAEISVSQFEREEKP